VGLGLTVLGLGDKESGERAAEAAEDPRHAVEVMDSACIVEAEIFLEVPTCTAGLGLGLTVRHSAVGLGSRTGRAWCNPRR